jgi:hypothetical protein
MDIFKADMLTVIQFVSTSLPQRSLGNGYQRCSEFRTLFATAVSVFKRNFPLVAPSLCQCLYAHHRYHRKPV